MLFEMSRGHARVAGYFRVTVKAILLAFTCPHDPAANRGGCFFGAFAGDVSIFDGRNFNVQIDAIEQGPGNTLAVPLHLHRTATAFAFQIAKIAARTGIHCRNEHELRWKSDAARRARHGDLPVFERLAHYFQGRPFELRQFIEEKNAVMGDADFAWIWKCAAAEQANVADGVVRIAERSRGNK